MRADMAKVIVERPRYGSRSPSMKKGYRKYLQKTNVDELPKRESMLGRWKGMSKELNEHLGPMRRFLRSNIGRPWNKVHQELCEFVSFDNAVQAHILAHIYQFVHRHVDVESSTTVISKTWWNGHRELRDNEMYVCPQSGLLKAVRKYRRKPRVETINIDLYTVLIRNGDTWWEVKLRERPKGANDIWDVWLESDVKKLTAQNQASAYGNDLVAVSKRPLNRSETKQLYRKIRKDNLRSKILLRYR